jgi:hypothetical protein
MAVLFLFFNVCNVFIFQKLYILSITLLVRGKFLR